MYVARTVLRGRATAMSSALAVVRRTGRDGRSGIVVLTGEPGIGKTAVLEELVAQARARGFAAGVGKADEVGQISPGAALLLALRSGASPLISSDVMDELQGSIDQPLRLLEQVSSRLEKAACVAPVVFAIDDAQWVDRLTRFVLRALPARLAGSPIVWVLAGRDAGGGLVADLAQAEIPSVPLERIQLGPLSAVDVAALAQDRLGAAPAEKVRGMLDGVGGNPFLVAQILDGVVRARADGEPQDQVPTEFVFATRRKLQGLDPGARQLVQTAAVFGRPFAVDDATALLAEHPAASVWDWVEAAVASGLLTSRDHRLGFRHDLVRETVYADLTEATRRALHQRCAEYLMATGHGPLSTAPHARASATPGDLASARILTQAADAAVTAMPHTAGDLALQAFQLLRPAQPAWLEVGEHCVDILSRVQRCSEAVAVADLLLARSDEPAATARVQVLAARALWLMGRVTDSLTRVDAALSQPGLSRALRSRLGSARALALTRTQPADVARQAAEPALAEARLTGDREAVTVALQALGEVAKNSGHHAEALTRFRELRSTAGHTHLAQEILALQLLDRFAEAETMLSAARTDARNQVEAILPSVLYAQLWQEYSLGRLDDADSTARTLIALSEELGNHTHGLQAVMITSSVALLRGDLTEARNRLAPAHTHVDADDQVRLPGLHLLQGWISAAEGNLDQAMAVLSPALHRAEESPTYWPWWPGWMRGFTRFGLAAGDLGFAEHAVAIAEEGAARNPGVASFEGIALQLRGTLREDLTLLRRGTEVLAHSPRPALRAGGHEDYGRALLAAGQRSEGAANLDLAWDLYHRIGARGSVLSLQNTMRGAGIRRSQWINDLERPRTGWAALSEAERRVAELISAGQTNQFRRPHPGPVTQHRGHTPALDLRQARRTLPRPTGQCLERAHRERAGVSTRAARLERAPPVDRSHHPTPVLVKGCRLVQEIRGGDAALARRERTGHIHPGSCGEVDPQRQQLVHGPPLDHDVTDLGPADAPVGEEGTQFHPLLVDPGHREPAVEADDDIEDPQSRPESERAPAPQADQSHPQRAEREVPPGGHAAEHPRLPGQVPQLLGTGMARQANLKLRHIQSC
ncbi:ATP-binding protein [Streptacidiphilus sp. PAMC 29251]